MTTRFYPSFHTGSTRLRLLFAGVFVLLWALPAGTASAQTPQPGPSILAGNPTSTRVEVNASLEKWNAARLQAGLAAISRSDASLPHPDSITISYEPPSPKVRGVNLSDGGNHLGFGPLATLAAQAAHTTPAASVKTAPGLDFAGPGLSDNVTLTGGSLFIPADIHMAAGSDDICAVVNVLIGCYDNTTGAATLAAQTLQTFFSSATSTFDPKVLWDHHMDRFVVVTLELTDSGSNPNPSNVSNILMAVSQTSDPSGGWFTQTIDAKTLIGDIGGGSEGWFDYPGFALDEDAVYITGNIFSFVTNTYNSTQLVIMDKGLYSVDDGSAVNIYDPFALTGACCDGTLQPAQMFGEPSTGGGVDVEVGTWMVEYSGISGGGTEALSVFRVDDPTGTPTFTQAFVFFGDVDDGTSMPDAPQLDDAGSPSAVDIETNDRRTLNAVWRGDGTGGELWTATTVVPGAGADAGQATAYFVNLSTSSTNVATLTDGGNIGGEDVAVGASTFFPSVAVDASGRAGFGFSVSGSTIYPSAYFVACDDGSAPCTLGSSDVLFDGVATYVRDFSGGKHRWGDYTSTVIDPDDDSFWVYNKYADNRGLADGSGDNGVWSTRIGNYDLSVLPVEVVMFEAVADGQAVTFSWATASEANNAGFQIEQQTGPGQWQPLGFIDGHGTTLESQYYTYRAEALAPGPHTFRLKQFDFDGAYAYGGTVEVMLALPTAFTLSNAYPNPFNPQTQFTLAVQTEQPVRVALYDMLGREVALLHEGLLEANRPHAFTIDGSLLPSGLYLYRAQGRAFTAARPVMLLK